MHPKLKEKIDNVRQEHQNKIDKENQLKSVAELRHQELIKAKIPEAKIWIENDFFNLIAKIDLEIETFNKSKFSNVKPRLKEIGLYKNIPSYLPEESILIALKEYEDIKIREQYIKEDYDPNDESRRTIIPGHYVYYIQW